MASLESAFKRHSRAQVATVPAVAHSKTKEPLSTPSPAFRSDGVVRRSRVLNAQSSPSWVPSSQVANERKQVSLARESLPVLAETTVPRLTPSHSSLTTLRWLDLVQLGKLVQGADEWLICSSRVEKKLYMLRGAEDRDATAVQKTVPFKHPHIVAAAFSVTSSDVRSFVGFPYVRFTLEELLYAHIKMDESQIQAVATSIFGALRYIDSAGFLHGTVDLQSIRVCGRTGRVMLSNCDRCVVIDNAPSTDLESLGLCILDCMEGAPKHLSIEEVRQQRATNKVFGLTDCERWSGHKQLVDFVDDLFSTRRKWQAKYERPHHYVAGEVENDAALLPLTALASMECFALWQRA